MSNENVPQNLWVGPIFRVSPSTKLRNSERQELFSKEEVGDDCKLYYVYIVIIYIVIWGIIEG